MTFNGKRLDDARLEHADLMQGGELVFYLSKKAKETQKLFLRPFGGKRQADYPAWEQNIPSVGTISSQGGNKKAEIAYTLNRQHRTWPLTFGWQGDTLVVTCKEAAYCIPRSVVEKGDSFCWDIPADGAAYEAKGTFAFISRQALRDLRKNGRFVYDGITWRIVDQSDATLHVRADIDQTEMWISIDNNLPLVLEMRNNPLGIDWHVLTDTSF